MENDQTKDNSLGGLSLPGASTGASDSASTTNVSASAEHIRQRKTRSDAGQPRGSRASANTARSVPPISPEAFARLYDPKIWSKALSAPADTAAALTGKARWELKEEERELLGSTGSLAASCFAVTDPRWLVLGLGLITLIDVYGVRLALELAERKAAAKEPKTVNDKK